MQGRSAGFDLFFPFTTIFLFITRSYVWGVHATITRSAEERLAREWPV